jgi:hypothetical protein
MIEVTTFRLLPGADPNAFASADERLQTEFYYGQPGLVRRTTAKSDDGTYAMITYWDSGDEAIAAAAVLVNARSWIVVSSFIDASTQTVIRFSPL